MYLKPLFALRELYKEIPVVLKLDYLFLPFSQLFILLLFVKLFSQVSESIYENRLALYVCHEIYFILRS